MFVVVKVCSKAKLMDATAYLLERSGDILGAFKLIREVSARVLAFPVSKCIHFSMFHYWHISLPITCSTWCA